MTRIPIMTLWHIVLRIFRTPHVRMTSPRAAKVRGLDLPQMHVIALFWDHRTA
jgi:hypothetical protein